MWSRSRHGRHGGLPSLVQTKSKTINLLGLALAGARRSFTGQHLNPVTFRVHKNAATGEGGGVSELYGEAWTLTCRRVNVTRDRPGSRWSGSGRSNSARHS